MKVIVQYGRCFPTAAVWIAVSLLLNVGDSNGATVGETLATELIKLGPAGFGTHFGLGTVAAVSAMGHGTFGATFRVKLQDESEFALKVATVASITALEKKAMIELKKKKFSFVPTIIEDFSKPSVTLPDGMKYATLASTLAGPDLKKIQQGDAKGNFPVGTIRRLASRLEKDLTALHGEGWCHNDLKLSNLAINGQADKQDQYFLLDYGEVTVKSATGNCRKDFQDLLFEVLKPLMAPYKGDADAYRPISNAQFTKLQGAFTSSNWVEFRRVLNEEILGKDAPAATLLTAWKPGSFFSYPSFTPVTKPFVEVK